MGRTTTALPRSPARVETARCVEAKFTGSPGRCEVDGERPELPEQCAAGRRGEIGEETPHPLARGGAEDEPDSLLERIGAGLQVGERGLDPVPAERHEGETL